MTRVLYLEGDACSPKYVAGALRAAGVDVTGDVTAAKDVDAVLLSDWPRRRLGRHETSLVRAVRRGAGLAMVGGWTSFGRGGWSASPLARLLPVHIRNGDDRANVPGGLWLQPPEAPHAIVQGLPFRRPPVVTGHNVLRGRAGARVALRAAPLLPTRAGGGRGVGVRLGRPRDLLWLREDSLARTAALAIDLAPHWSGGMTDWGRRRVDVGEGEQLGDAYVRFVARLVGWVAGAHLAAQRPAQAPRGHRRRPARGQLFRGRSSERDNPLERRAA